MKVGILGSGDVGRALGRGFAGRGHDVMIGSRTPKSDALAKWRRQAKGRATTGSVEEAARHGEVIVLATLGAAVERVLEQAGRANFDGKVVIDVTNPLADDPNLVPFVGMTDSLGERIQRALPRARVVKAFNTVPAPQMVDPKFAGGTPDMMICGNDAAAKTTVIGILKEFGWPEALDLGGIEGARWLEAAVSLWVLIGMRTGRWDHAFKVVHG